MNKQPGFGTGPVFFTAIATILGAILFLRFGYAVGNLGFWGVILIVVLGHMITIPTALAISELATNKKVEGGGEYFIISRSFGLNIGATIGIALYLSQAISVAFYVIAFTEAFQFAFDYFKDIHGMDLPRQAISMPVMLLLTVLIVIKGANLGVKALYFVVGILFVSLILFFAGSSDFASTGDFSLANASFRGGDNFFVIFAIVFPAFTGMTAGVGLSGDLKKPSKSIPLGTTLATVIGLIIYFFIVYKLAVSASVEDLKGDQLIMAKIAIGGAIVIPLGLAASTISSALGSVMVAPRTLQALSLDNTFPSQPLNKWLGKGRTKDKEPVNASIVTCLIAIFFVAVGDVNFVAEIISMFFMVTYGSLCLISFLNHFGSSPSYRPSFKSRWYISLFGFIVSVLVMFKINALYTLLAFAIMIAIYLYLNYYHKDRKGLEAIFANSIFQVNRNLQVYLQKSGARKKNREWRPSAICISKDSFERTQPFKLLNWISYRYGFGTYIHYVEGFYSKETYEKAEDVKEKLIGKFDKIQNHVYIDTIISPSYTSAIAQSIQLPGVSGMENNIILFEYEKEEPDNLPYIIQNFSLVNAGNFDVCIMASSKKQIEYIEGIHIWINSKDLVNTNLMILLGFVISGHPDWKKSNIKIFETCAPGEVEAVRKDLDVMLKSGRLPITSKNITIIPEEGPEKVKGLVNQYSSDAGLVIIGFGEDALLNEGEKLFSGFEKVGTMLFVHASSEVNIE